MKQSFLLLSDLAKNYQSIETKEDRRKGNKFSLIENLEKSTMMQMQLVWLTFPAAKKMSVIMSAALDRSSKTCIKH